MATYAELKLHHRLFTERYPFERYAVSGRPTAIFEKPLRNSKFALITTAGLMLESDRRFSSLFKFGDHSFREIPNDADIQTLIEDHSSSSFDHSGIEADKNVALPLERFQELEKKNKIGGLNHRHFSFMGSMLAPTKLINETAPEVARLLVEDKVDAVFLTPV